MIKAIHSQSRIGWSLMLRSFLSKQWTTALYSLGMTYPTRAISWTIQFLWYEYIDVIWRSRNDILHNTLNENTKLAESQLQDRLHWFLDNRSCLAHGDRYLLAFTHTDISSMTPSTGLTLFTTTSYLLWKRASHKSQTILPLKKYLLSFLFVLSFLVPIGDSDDAVRGVQS